MSLDMSNRICRSIGGSGRQRQISVSGTSYFFKMHINQTIWTMSPDVRISDLNRLLDNC